MSGQPAGADTAESSLGPILIIGTGLVGASVGCALTAAGEEVHLRDKVLSHARVAAGRGAGQVESIDPEAVALVVVAVPPRALPGVLSAALDEFPNATITDVGSIKQGVLTALESEGLELRRYVGSHPMAGSHLAGPVTATPDLFIDRSWVVTPHATATPGAVDAVIALGKACGARTLLMDPHEHDLAVAAVSHLPHAVSAMVAAGLEGRPADHLALAGQGVRDVTRIAAGDPVLWEQILAGNSAAVGRELSALGERISELGRRLEMRGDVKELLEAGRRGTQAIPGKHGGRPIDYAVVTVEIPDTPGSLAHLFADADDAGVNIEDISIEHDEVRQVGRLLIELMPDRAESFAEFMRGRGWRVV
ncbi:prephenate dehydrogenase [Granulicoccus sp. GXG6511]|uniref:prephenate dehydrogenase n=1 Tax=Granulicoccus sp. GXG6511 TaxID=3381351 RepID=UPI003D7E7FBE